MCSLGPACESWTSSFCFDGTFIDNGWGFCSEWAWGVSGKMVHIGFGLLFFYIVLLKVGIAFI